MVAVQSSRRGGQFERALDWVILWLKALGDNITAHMAEPVTLWVKTKIDAFRNGEEDVRLRYTDTKLIKSQIDLVWSLNPNYSCQDMASCRWKCGH